MMHVLLQAGEGEDGRMKSAIGIGALLMDGLGDTIRVSLTEDPELEIVPCGCAPAPYTSFCPFSMFYQSMQGQRFFPPVGNCSVLPAIALLTCNFCASGQHL